MVATGTRMGKIMQSYKTRERDDELLQLIAWRLKCDKYPHPLGKDHKLKERLKELLDGKSS